MQSTPFFSPVLNQEQSYISSRGNLDSSLPQPQSSLFGRSHSNDIFSVFASDKTIDLSHHLTKQLSEGTQSQMCSHFDTTIESSTKSLYCSSAHPYLIEILIKSPTSFIDQTGPTKLKFNPYNPDRFDPYFLEFVQSCEKQEISYQDAITQLENQPKMIDIQQVNIYIKQYGQTDPDSMVHTDYCMVSFASWSEYSAFALEMFAHLSGCEHYNELEVCVTQINFGTKQQYCLKNFQFSHDSVTRLAKKGLSPDQYFRFPNDDNYVCSAYSFKGIKPCSVNVTNGQAVLYKQQSKAKSLHNPSLSTSFCQSNRNIHAKFLR